MNRGIKSLIGPKSLIIWGIFFASLQIWGQDFKMPETTENRKPKIALVLSGGGAKGIAHIPLLQALDSLNIVPDFVVGTSMGSIVGGLYAMGYSGDSISQIAHQANWRKLLGGKTLLSSVGVEEKSEFGRYLFELNLVNGKPNINPAILNDQLLREFLSQLTYPVYRIDSFDDLPIPYRAVATDIVNGELVILDRGSLAQAMRASMSIPTVFKPVRYENTLLVDGGILNNFPTDIAKSMGADIIIGSDVGGGMLTRDKLSDPIKLIFQTSMLTSNLIVEENRALCDILLNHEKHLTYSTGDFVKANEIYVEGKEALIQNMDALEQLAEILKKYPKPRPNLPKIAPKFTLDTIVYKNISKDNLDLVRARIRIEPGQTYNVNDLNSGINRLMGTNLFDAIYFNPLVKKDSLGIELEGLERSRHTVKGALHYDTHRGVGLLMNYTGRNIIGKASRSLVSIDIAEQPSLRLQHQKIFGVQKNWWWRTDLLGQLLNESVYIEGRRADDVNHDVVLFQSQFNRNLFPFKSYVGFGINHQYDYLRPKTDPDLGDNVLGLRKYGFHNLEAGVHFFSNSMESVFFPKRGTLINAFIKRSLWRHIRIQGTIASETINEGSTNGFTKFGAHFEKRIHLDRHLAFLFSGSGYFTIINKLDDNEISYADFGISSQYSLGGYNPSPIPDNFTFPGLYETELFASQVIMGSVGLQWEPTRNIYFSPHFHLASLGYEGFKEYFENFSSQTTSWHTNLNSGLLITGGATLSYDSFLGPVHLDLSYVNGINKLRLFFSVGIPLGKSN